MKRVVIYQVVDKDNIVIVPFFKEVDAKQYCERPSMKAIDAEVTPLELHVFESITDYSEYKLKKIKEKLSEEEQEIFETTINAE